MFHIAIQGIQQGPLSEADVRQKIAKGELQPSDLCWQPGWPEWRKVAVAFPSTAVEPPPIPPVAQQAALRAPIAPAPTFNGAPKTSGLAIVSLVCGICTIVLFPLFFIFMIPAIVCGHVAQSRIKQAKGALAGAGLAIAGLCMGYAGIVMVPLVAAMAIPAFQKVRMSSLEKTMDNDARQIASAAQQYFLETNVTSVPFGYEPATGRVSGPLGGYLKTIGRGYTRTPDELTSDGTFQLVHPHAGPARTYDSDGRRQR